ncbi:MAG: phage integrase N-terminal SAM-like domain-containing protein, partial [Chloroflexota bacterium]|nr:phage integrase N-terminal SAM-like domain-containing protein [Chloroflexota bacterium]
EHTVRAYTVAVRDFLLWYRDEEGRSPTLADLTPIALLGYRNELQHERGKSTSTVNTRLAGLRAFCGWLACYQRDVPFTNQNRLVFEVELPLWDPKGPPAGPAGPLARRLPRPDP